MFKIGLINLYALYLCESFQLLNKGVKLFFFYRVGAVAVSNHVILQGQRKKLPGYAVG